MKHLLCTRSATWKLDTMPGTIVTHFNWLTPFTLGSQIKYSIRTLYKDVVPNSPTISQEVYIPHKKTHAAFVAYIQYYLWVVWRIATSSFPQQGNKTYFIDSNLVRHDCQSPRGFFELKLWTVSAVSHSNIQNSAYSYLYIQHTFQKIPTSQ